MEHPFAPDLSDKTLDELQETIVSLNTKLVYAYRTGNSALIAQLNMMIESHRNCFNKKMDEMFAKRKMGAAVKIQSAKDDSSNN